MSDINDVSIKISDNVIHGWTGVKVNRSMEKFAGSFELTFKLDLELMEFLVGQDPVELYIGKDKVLTGYIFGLKPTISDGGDTITIIGREKTADLVDCSAVNDPGMWRNVSLETIVKSLSEPFGIDVIVNTDIGDRFTKWSINTGESVFEAIKRACVERAVIPIPNVDGNIEITTTSNNSANDALVYGKNIIIGSSDIDYSRRYSVYTVKSQTSSPGGGWNKSKISIFKQAFDLGVERYRPLQIRANNQMTNKIAQETANWESQVRAGASSSSSITVKEWHQSDNSLWLINHLVNIDVALLNLRTTLLISETTFSYNNSGRIAILKIVDPSTFAPKPKVKTTKKSKSGWKLR